MEVFIIMIFFVNFETLLEHWVLTLLVIIFLTISGVIVYKKAVKSRKYYKCPQCGESFRSEYMDSKCCKVCGAELTETNNTDVNDRAI